MISPDEPFRLDREFWDAIRRALLMVVAAIEKRWNLKPHNGK